MTDQELISFEAYLHELNNGFDNEKRRQVRVLFQEIKQAEVEPEAKLPDSADLIIGALEEFYHIGIKEFSVSHLLRTLDIFGFLGAIDEDEVQLVLQHPRISVYKSNPDTYVVPDSNRIFALKQAYCTEAAKAKRGITC